MPATSRNVKRRPKKHRPALKQAIQPGYCSSRNWEGFLQFVVTRQLQEGVEITVQMLLDGANIPKGEGYLVRAAARHLQLLDASNCTTKKLVMLAQASGDEEKRAILREVVEDAYHDELERIDDLDHASQAQLRDTFNRNGAYESTTLQKIIAHFKLLCLMAGIATNESDASQEVSEQITDTPSLEPPLNAVSLEELVRYEPVAESSTPKSNGVNHAHSDYSDVEDLLTSFEDLHQELDQSTKWTEADRVRWEKYLKMTHALLGKAIKLMGRPKQ